MRVGIEFTRTRQRNQRYPIFIHTSAVTGAGNIHGDLRGVNSVANGVLTCFFPWRSMEKYKGRVVMAVHITGTKTQKPGGAHIQVLRD